MTPQEKKIIIKALTVKEPITIHTLSMWLANSRVLMTKRALRMNLAKLEQDGYLLISNSKGHKLATSAKEYHNYRDYVDKYLKAFAKKKRTIDKNWKRYTANLFKHENELGKQLPL